jgi:hypothetical protein
MISIRRTGDGFHPGLFTMALFSFSSNSWISSFLKCSILILPNTHKTVSFYSDNPTGNRTDKSEK